MINMSSGHMKITHHDFRTTAGSQLWRDEQICEFRTDKSDLLRQAQMIASWGNQVTKATEASLQQWWRAGEG
jgi:hypothetical protein